MVESKKEMEGNLDKARFVAELLHGDKLAEASEASHIQPHYLTAIEAPTVESVLTATREEAEALKRELAEHSADVVERFREVWDAEETTLEHVQGFVDRLLDAVTDPAGFYDANAHTLAPPIIRPTPPPPESVRDAAKDKRALDELKRRYPIARAVEITPEERKYEWKDVGWWRLKWFLKHREQERSIHDGSWVDGFPTHTEDNSSFIYEGSRGDADHGIPVALFADFGTGCYQSLAIAKQLERAQYPYAFHLGDVYYGGTEPEFANHYEGPLRDVLRSTRLYSLVENHELYSKGRPYLEFLRRARRRGETLQQGSYFCVRFPHHQIIGLDVNSGGRGRFHKPAWREWLTGVLADSEGRTNILLTGSGPYVYGSAHSTPLFNDLWDFVKDGEIAAWFWGNNHYCALFSSSSGAPFVGSCIGHGGYPGERKSSDDDWAHRTQWLETEPRFPSWTDLRQDRGNNGWCQAVLRADGGLDLLYIDWLGIKRYAARYGASGSGQLVLDDWREWPRDKQGSELWSPVHNLGW